MPTQKALLLNFREKLSECHGNNNLKASYNIQLGLWENGNGSPLIKDILIRDNYEDFGTRNTATREATDQTEDSMSVLDGTQITETREGIDRSEHL
jgi:hypothetical protein